MAQQNYSVVDIKLRIYQKILYLGGTIPFVIWLFDRQAHPPNPVNSVFLPIISVFCLISILLFRRRGEGYLSIFETIVFVGVYVYMTSFLVRLALDGMNTGVFYIQKFLLWIPMLHITSFMMFSKATALRHSISFTAIILAIGALFLFSTKDSSAFSSNFQLFFEIFAANVMYMIILYVIVLLKESVHRGEIRAALVTELALTDPLTGVFNRRKINQLLNEYLHEQGAFSVIMVDIDHFKRVNDTFGHEQGDLILKKIAALLRTNMRQQDVVGRWGGDEFLVVCVNTSDLDNQNIQNRILTINENPLLKSAGCSLSFGISSFERGDTLVSLLRRADENLYRQKREIPLPVD